MGPRTEASSAPAGTALAPVELQCSAAWCSSNPLAGEELSANGRWGGGTLGWSEVGVVGEMAESAGECQGESVPNFTGYRAGTPASLFQHNLALRYKWS